MTIKTSTGLRNGMLGTSSMATQLNGGFIKIYSGTVPATADDAIGAATLLCTISVNGDGTTGLQFDTAAANGVMVKLASQAWRNADPAGNVAAGTASFYRWVTSIDAGALSTTLPRIQGTVGTAGADLNLSSVGLALGAAQTIDYYTVALPTA